MTQTKAYRSAFRELLAVEAQQLTMLTDPIYRAMPRKLIEDFTARLTTAIRAVESRPDEKRLIAGQYLAISIWVARRAMEIEGREAARMKA